MNKYIEKSNCFLIQLILIKFISTLISNRQIQNSNSKTRKKVKYWTKKIRNKTYTNWITEIADTKYYTNFKQK